MDQTEGRVRKLFSKTILLHACLINLKRGALNYDNRKKHLYQIDGRGRCST